MSPRTIAETLTELQQELKDARGSNSKLKQELNSTRGSNAELQQELHNTRSSNTELQQEPNNARRSNTKLQNAPQHRSNALDAREITAQNHDNTQGTQTTESKLESRTRRLAILTLKYKNLENEYEQLKENFDNTNTANTVLTLKYENLQKEYAELKENFDDANRARIEDERSEVDVLRAQITALTFRYEDLKNKYVEGRGVLNKANQQPKPKLVSPARNLTTSMSHKSERSEINNVTIPAASKTTNTPSLNT